MIKKLKKKFFDIYFSYKAPDGTMRSENRTLYACPPSHPSTAPCERVVGLTEYTSPEGQKTVISYVSGVDGHQQETVSSFVG